MRKLGLALLLTLFPVLAQAQESGPMMPPDLHTATSAAFGNVVANATPASARKTLNTGLVNVLDYGAIGDALRVQCSITTVASNTSVTVAPGDSHCAFTSADVGKKIVIYNVGSTATTPLATAISAVTSGTTVTLAVAPSQTRTASTQWVSWGTNNSTALSNAYAQAAKLTDVAGQTGFVYFPPGPAASNATGVVINGFGTSGTVNLSPNAFPIKTEGAGRFSSVVLALGSMSSLAFIGTGYVNGPTITDITFDGNMLATDTALLNCMAVGEIRNVSFSNPAPGGIAYVQGEPGSGSCPATITSNLYVEANSYLYTNSAQYADKLVSINSTDTQHYGLQVVGEATTASIQVESPASNTTIVGHHIWGQATGNALVSLATKVWQYSPQVDVSTTITGIHLKAGQQSIVGGRTGAPTSGTVGIQIDSSLSGISILGYSCTDFTVGTCISPSYPVGSNNIITANPGSTIAPAAAQKIGQSPAGTGSTTGVMAGLALAITPKTSGRVVADASGYSYNTTSGNGVTLGLRLTPTAQANGAACSGTAVGADTSAKNATNFQNLPTALHAVFGGLTVGSTYYLDVCQGVASGGDMNQVVNLFAEERNTW